MREFRGAEASWLGKSLEGNEQTGWAGCTPFRGSTARQGSLGARQRTAGAAHQGRRWGLLDDAASSGRAVVVMVVARVVVRAVVVVRRRRVRVVVVVVVRRRDQVAVLMVVVVVMVVAAAVVVVARAAVVVMSRHGCFPRPDTLLTDDGAWAGAGTGTGASVACLLAQTTLGFVGAATERVRPEHKGFVHARYRNGVQLQADAKAQAGHENSGGVFQHSQKHIGGMAFTTRSFQLR